MLDSISFKDFNFLKSKKKSGASAAINSSSKGVFSVPQDIPSSYVGEKDCTSAVFQDAGGPLRLSDSNTDKALAATNSILAMLEHFASLAPIPGIDGVIQLIRSVLKRVQTVRSNNVEIEDLIRQICFLLVSISPQASESSHDNVASEKFKDVVEQFSDHLRVIERLCVDLSKNHGLHGVLEADSIKKDIARIRGEIDLAFKTFCVTSMTFLNGFLEAWKKESKADVDKVLIAIADKASENTKNVKGETPTVSITNCGNADANNGVIESMDGSFNSDNVMTDQQSSFWAAIADKNASNITNCGNARSNNGYIGKIGGSFNSNNRNSLAFTPINTFGPVNDIYHGHYYKKNSDNNTGIIGNGNTVTKGRSLGIW